MSGGQLQISSIKIELLGWPTKWQYKKRVNDTEFLVTENRDIPFFLGKQGCLFTKNVTEE